MKDSTLMWAGAVGAVLAAICCATPLLAVLLGVVGLSAWAAKADYLVLPHALRARLSQANVRR
jgi:mercuric ion transport protein